MMVAVCVRLALLLVLAGLDPTLAATPNSIISIQGTKDSEFLVKRADFGSKDAVVGSLVSAPSADPYLCNFVNSSNPSSILAVPPEVSQVSGAVMFVPRGLCTFEMKAIVASRLYGASGIIIFDSLQARYLWNATEARVRYPIAKRDYECNNGLGEMTSLNLDPPAYNGEILDPLMDLTLGTAECELDPPNRCDSQLCLVTSHVQNSTNYPVCCAWDLPLTMQPDSTIPSDSELKDFTDDIVAMFMTVRQTEQFSKLAGDGSTVKMEPRPYQVFNVSMVFMWFLGVATTGFACWYAAADYRFFQANIDYQRERYGLNELPLVEMDENPDTDYSPDDVEAQSSDSGLEALESTRRELDPKYTSGSLGERRQQRNRKSRPSLPVSGESPQSHSPKVLGETSLPPKPVTTRSQLGASGEVGPEATRLTSDDIPADPDPSTGGATGERNLTTGTGSHSKKKKKRKKRRAEKEKFVLYSLPPPSRSDRDLDVVEQEATDIDPENESSISNKVIAPRPWSMQGSFQLNMYHVLIFVIVASILLFLLFFFNFYNAIFVLYGIGCAGAVSHLIFGPILVRIIPKYLPSWSDDFATRVCLSCTAYDIVSQCFGFIWAGVWIWYGLTHYRPSTNWFFWLTMDVFGICFSVLVLSMLKLNSIKIGTIFMLAIFFYDIFFVFITPLFFDGRSVMLTVASGGSDGTSTADDLCVKYPKDKDCTGIDFLPMLLILPRVNDYLDRSILLGLGDIVLPGFVIAFGARLDEARRIVCRYTKVDSKAPMKWYHGYFLALMVAYGVGLFFAQLAVALMEMGQPALLYIVPCLLFTTFFVGRHEIRQELWNPNGSHSIRLAEKLMRKMERAIGRHKMRQQVAKWRQNKQAKTENDGNPTNESFSIHHSLGDVQQYDSSQTTSRTRRSASKERRGQEPQPRRSSREHRQEDQNETSAPLEEAEQPLQKDICFDKKSQPGTQALRRATRKIAIANPNTEYGPEIYRSIRRSMKGRHFFKRSKPGGQWEEVTKHELVSRLRSFYEEEQNKLHTTED